MCEREIACGRERKVKRLETDRQTHTDRDRGTERRRVQVHVEPVEKTWRTRAVEEGRKREKKKHNDCYSE